MVWGLAADQRDPESQLNLGLNHAAGRGVSQDLVAANLWLSIAATQPSAEDRDRYAGARDFVAGRMTAERVAEANALPANGNLRSNHPDRRVRARVLQWRPLRVV